jgi:hypothetical protein
MRTLVAAALALALAGCAESRCRLGWHGVEASGPRCTVSGNAYEHLNLMGQRPDGTWWTPFFLRMPDGRVLAHDEITPNAIGPYDPTARLAGIPTEDPSSWTGVLQVVFVADDRSLGSYRMWFVEGRFESITVQSRVTPPDPRGPAVTVPGGGPPVPLPLTDRELVRLFGPWRSHTDSRRILFFTFRSEGPTTFPSPESP